MHDLGGEAQGEGCWPGVTTCAGTCMLWTSLSNLHDVVKERGRILPHLGETEFCDIPDRLSHKR